jgi:hypothetical protein
MAKFKEMRPGVFCHFCPGCECSHWIYTDGKVTWSITGEADKPTVRPSLAHDQGNRKTECHYHITDGKLEFFFDTHHQYRSQTIDVPEWDERIHNPYKIRPKHEGETIRNRSPKSNAMPGFNFNDRN